MSYLPSQTLLEGSWAWGYFILDEPFLRLEAPMRKVIVAILCFIFYILPIAPTSPTHLPPGCTKGQSKGREHRDSHFWDGRERRESWAQALWTTDTTGFLPSIFLSCQPA